MSSRNDILAAIRRHLPQAVPLPDHAGDWIQYPDPISQFRSVLEGVGGKLHEVDQLDEIPARLGDLIAPDKLVISCVPGLLEERFDWSTVSDPHQLEQVEHALLPGVLGVAENAAIWVTDEHVPEKVLFFLTQHLSLVLPRQSLVHNMHEAYERITPDERPFGAFISGPSKTADIEQALVKGAHGARTLNVFLVQNWNNS